MRTQSRFLTAPVGPMIIRLAMPSMLGMFVTMVTLAAEAWYVSHLGTVALAGGRALAFPMMLLTMFLSAGSIGGAITGAVAQRLGAADRDGAEILAFHAVVQAIPLAVLSSIVFLGGGLILLRSEENTPVDFFWLIAAGMVTQAIVSGVAIYFGAWRRGLYGEESEQPK